MSADFKPSYLSGVLRAGARPFDASAPAAPRRSTHALPLPHTNVAAPADAADFETSRTDPHAHALADDSTPPLPAQPPTHPHTSDDAPAAHTSARTQEQAPLREPAPPHLPDGLDAPLHPRAQNVRFTDSSNARTPVENSLPHTDLRTRAGVTPDEGASQTTTDAQPAQESHADSPRFNIASPSVNDDEEATERSVAPRVGRSQVPHAQASEPHKTLEAHISELRARMQVPRDERLGVQDAAANAHKSSSTSQPRSLQSHSANESRTPDAATTRTSTPSQPAPHAPTHAASFAARPRESNREADIAHAPQANVRQATMMQAAARQTPREIASTRPPSEPRPHAPAAHATGTHATPTHATRTHETRVPESSRAHQARTPETESRRETPMPEERAPRLSINRLDVRIVDQTPAAPPAPVPQTRAPAPTSAPSSDGWAALDRHYLGRFYLG
ncbi:MAG TPA: hypothetical protein VGV59_19470 [Pyrinomonadaceae bacterium]|nr:hypothetical protein [Pyrinomonadaceae bacterium]